jgi:hypothetical protein
MKKYFSLYRNDPVAIPLAAAYDMSPLLDATYESSSEDDNVVDTDTLVVAPDVVVEVWSLLPLHHVL